ncbi:MFS transporter [Ligilactobacillus ruminis]|uniref:MFS transporter n=1 Tax=Ligilactobacillus ruminis TaxID=1623 RepID=UPI001C016922|nr:MFS transporter [Ligilactobacillus ruminis]MBT9627020.1 MFS transporter [Ligilactobacillus ruminis]
MKYRSTMNACFTGYIVQAIVNNFVPLLFVTFQNSWHIPLSRITMLITVNFIIQLSVDLASAGFVDRLGYRASAVTAHLFSAAGLLMLTFLPDMMPDPFYGILISVIVYAVGGGLIEVLISPIIESCPTDNKETAMSLLHSFYCWGYMGVVLFSTVFFALFGIGNWRALTLVWAVIPVVNAVVFCKVPLFSLDENEETGMSISSLISDRKFLMLMLMMLSAGAGEQSVSQWASTFAEEGLGLSKTVGDLAGPMMFALMMGLSRVLYSRYGDRIELDSAMKFSAAACVISYVCIAIPSSVLGIVGCALCGFSVGILWPGTFSLASRSLVRGGTAMFALLALAGDLGCTAGPTLAGMISSAAGDNLRLGVFAAVIFPVMFLIAAVFLGNRRKEK